MDLTRRRFVSMAAAAAVPDPARRSILNFNENMEYRRLGKTGLMVSAIGVGGHWKRLSEVTGQNFEKDTFYGNDTRAASNPALVKNRADVLSRAIDLGVNYIDACSGPEVCVYAAALKGRRHKMHFGYSWGFKESRHAEYRSAPALLRSLDEGLRAAGLDYVDLWRISLPMTAIPDLDVVKQVEDGAIEAMEKARKSGKARFTGVSSHNRVWLEYLVKTYPDQMQVVLFPYTANTKEMPTDSIFDTLRKHDTGVFGIKPFADNSLFLGDSSPRSPYAAEDSRRARLALRYILGNSAITAPIPGIASMEQLDNAAKAVAERRTLDRREKAELDAAGRRMWANLRPSHCWLRNWQYV